MPILRHPEGARAIPRVEPREDAPQAATTAAVDVDKDTARRREPRVEPTEDQDDQRKPRPRLPLPQRPRRHSSLRLVVIRVIAGATAGADKVAVDDGREQVVVRVEGVDHPRLRIRFQLHDVLRRQPDEPVADARPSSHAFDGKHD